MLKDLTPKRFRACGIAACPSVFSTENGSYIVVGRKVHASVIPEGRVNPDEEVVEVPKELLEAIDSRSASGDLARKPALY